MKRSLMALVIGIAVFLTACASTEKTSFIISKGNRAYYFGRQEKSLKLRLCDTGDFRRVLRDAQIRKDLKKKLYRYICTKEASPEKARATYAYLSPEEKKSLKHAFVLHGYAINYVPC